MYIHIFPGPGSGAKFFLLFSFFRKKISESIPQEVDPSLLVEHNDFCLINEHTKESSTSTIVDVEFSKANITLLERLDALTPYNIYQVTMGAFSSIEYKKVLIFQFKRENVVYDLIVVFDFFQIFHEFCDLEVSKRRAHR